MNAFLRDLRFAFRGMRRAPVLFTAAVLTLAAGVGLSTGVFALAYGLLLRPLPFPEPERLIAISLVRGPGPRGSNVPLAEVEEWRRRLRTFERIGAHSSSDFTLRAGGEARSVRATLITDGFFETLGMPAKEGTTSVVARGLSTAAFSSRLAEELAPTRWRDEGVIVGGVALSIATVMPPQFAFPAENTAVWLPADAMPGVAVFSADDQRRYQIIGRLAPGVSIEQARDDVSRVSKEIDAEASRPQPREVSVYPLQERGRQDARATVIPFAAGAALVLLVAAANVSGLLVGRMMTRRREFAVRRALGGGSIDVLRTALAESSIVALGGWLIGLWIAFLLIRGFESIAAGTIPNLQSVRVDTPVILFSLALALVVGILSGGAPALRAARTDPSQALKQTSERIGGGGAAVRASLVVAQIAMTVVLLVAAGLLMRTVVGIISADRSFDPKQALALRLALTETTRFNSVDRAPMIDRLLAEVRRLPGVVSAGVGSDLPPSGSQLTMTISLVGNDRKVVLPLSYAAATPGYLEALGIKPIAGRLLEEQDRLAAQPVVIITETAARTFFPDQDAVGRDLPAPLPRADGKRARPRIVGVVKDVEYGGLDRAAGASIFTTWETLAPGNAHLVVRTSGRPLSVAAAVRRVVQELDPMLPSFTPQTLDEVVAGSIADRRLRLRLAAMFAALALALAAVAIWGAVAQNVLDRRRELAVRLALGATHRAAIGLMLRSGVMLTACGVGLGIAGAIAAARAMRHLLYGVAPWDPLSFAAGAAITMALAMTACYLPARKAASISPSELLREA